MICDFDFFRLKKPIYEVKRIIDETNINADNGIREIYVNLKSLPEDKNLYNLFKILTDKNFIDDKNFPALSSKKPSSIRGGKKMFTGLTRKAYDIGVLAGEEHGIEQGISEGKKILLIDLLNQNIITEDVVMDKLNITKEELEELKKKYK